MLSSILARRLTTYLEARGVLPPEQQGFRRDRSTMTACSELIAEIRYSLVQNKTPLYALFVDYKVAFDTAPRSILIQKLANVGVGLLKLLASIHEANPIVLDDGVCEHEPFLQTTGYAQDDNLSALFFTVLMSDLPSLLNDHSSCVKITQYADDVVLYSRLLLELKKGAQFLIEYSRNNNLILNTTRTKAIKFMSGGRPRETDQLSLEKTKIEFVPQFTYLGLELTSSGTSFGAHVAERVRKGTVAMSSIPCPQFFFRGTSWGSAGAITEPPGLRGNAHGTLEWFFICPTSVGTPKLPRMDDRRKELSNFSKIMLFLPQAEFGRCRRRNFFEQTADRPRESRPTC